MTPISSFESRAGNRHFSSSRPALVGLIADSAELKRVPPTSWLYMGQSLASSNAQDKAQSGVEASRKARARVRSNATQFPPAR